MYKCTLTVLNNMVLVIVNSKPMEYYTVYTEHIRLLTTVGKWCMLTTIDMKLIRSEQVDNDNIWLNFHGKFI